MNELQVFSFKDNSIRTVVDADQKVWFVARDVAVALGYADAPAAITQHCKKSVQVVDFIRVGETHTLDKLNELQPQTKLIPESDVYRLVMRSKLSSAEKFQDWIVEEVLPAIRKTGSYSIHSQATNNELAIRDLKVHLEVMKLFECPLHLAQIESVKQVQKSHGIDFSYALLLAPSQDNIAEEELMLEPTELGKVLGYTAIAMNKKLCAMGLQTKAVSGWYPTSAGEGLCTKHAWKKGDKSGYNLKWNITKIKVLI
jgi:prophage antirepressor-like protein